MLGQTVSHCSVIKKLGGGGMVCGTVNGTYATFEECLKGQNLSGSALRIAGTTRLVLRLPTIWKQLTLGKRKMPLDAALVIS
jgi:hypothetical protein